MYFERYFTKKRVQFERAKFGFCCAKQENVQIHNSCDQFQFKYRRTPRAINSMARIRLDGLLTELTVVRNLLEEEVRENEDIKKSAEIRGKKL